MNYGPPVIVTIRNSKFDPGWIYFLVREWVTCSILVRNDSRISKTSGENTFTPRQTPSRTDSLDSQNLGAVGKIPALPETPENIVESNVFSVGNVD